MSKNKITSKEEEISGKEKNPKKIQRTRYVFVGIVFLLAFVFFILYLIWSYFQRPVSSSSIRTIQTSVAEPKREKKTETLFEGKHVSFKHEGTYQQKTHTAQENDGQKFLEMAFWAEEKEISKKLALTVETIENGNPGNSSSYLMRDSSPQAYVKEVQRMGNNQVVTFLAKNGPFEKAGFVISGNKMTILVLSAPMTEDPELHEEFEKALESLKWKE